MLYTQKRNIINVHLYFCTFIILNKSYVKKKIDTLLCSNKLRQYFNFKRVSYKMLKTNFRYCMYILYIICTIITTSLTKMCYYNNGEYKCINTKY